MKQLRQLLSTPEVEMVYRIHQTHFVLESIQEEIITNFCEISYMEFKVLMATRHKESMNQTDIARFWHVSRATVSRTIADLVNKKLVRRVEKDRNRRTTEISLTKEGRRTLVRVMKTLEKHLLSELEVLTKPEMHSIIDGLRTLYSKMCDADVENS